MTTPTGLRLAMIAALLGALLLGAVAARAALDRQRAADSVAHSTTTLLAAQDLYVALARADAAASTIFLRAGLEPSELRQRYLADIEAAGKHLSAIAGEQRSLTPAAKESISLIHERVGRYTGLVESARANSAWGFAIGAAYLRDASELMRAELLPAALSIYDEAVRQVDDQQRAEMSGTSVLGIAAAAIVVVAIFAAAQLFLTRRMRRLVSLWLAGAIIVVIGLCVWAMSAFDSQRDAVVESRRTGSDPLVALSVARILALQSLSDQNLDLIERGTEAGYLEDFATVTARISGAAGEPGLIDVAAAGSAHVDGISRALDDYLKIQDRVSELDKPGFYDDAVKTAVGDLASAANTLDEEFKGQILVISDTFAQDTGQARSALGWLPVGVVLLAASAGLLAAVGLRIRLREYQ